MTPNILLLNHHGSDPSTCMGLRIQVWAGLCSENQILKKQQSSNVKNASAIISNFVLLILYKVVLLDNKLLHNRVYLTINNQIVPSSGKYKQLMVTILTQIKFSEIKNTILFIENHTQICCGQSDTNAKNWTLVLCKKVMHF